MKTTEAFNVVFTHLQVKRRCGGHKRPQALGLILSGSPCESCSPVIVRQVQSCPAGQESPEGIVVAVPCCVDEA